MYRFAISKRNRENDKNATVCVDIPQVKLLAHGRYCCIYAKYDTIQPHFGNLCCIAAKLANFTLRKNL
jgi:hypothetical protein